MCHTPQTVDPDTGNTVDMKVFIHKLHMGSQLPSVKAGTPYQVIRISPLHNFKLISAASAAVARSPATSGRCPISARRQPRRMAVAADSLQPEPLFAASSAQVAHAFDFYTNRTLIPAAKLARVPSSSGAIANSEIS